jgi:hypothetical protein
LHLKGARIVTGLRQTGVRWNPALYAYLEAGSGAEMLVMQNGALHAARARLGHPEDEHQR